LSPPQIARAHRAAKSVMRGRLIARRPVTRDDLVRPSLTYAVQTCRMMYHRHKAKGVPIVVAPLGSACGGTPGHARVLR
jgi:hypothetical protein